MNKMVKGAIATGVGVILLVGGGGTLATWNQSVDASTGTVVAGDLNMVPGAGVWQNAVGTVIDTIGDYRVVPGDVLTYTQPLEVTLEGDLMVANLTVENADGATFDDNATVSATTLTNAQGEVLPSTNLTEGDSGTVTASTTFTFDVNTGAQDATNATHALGTVTYELNQVAPANTPATTPATTPAQ